MPPQPSRTDESRLGESCNRRELREDFGGEYPFADRFLTLEVGPKLLTSSATEAGPKLLTSSATEAGAAARLGESCNGLRYHYVDEGPRGDAAAPVLLFVHGNPTWSFAWRNFIKEFSPQYRCVAVDHIGCGRSDKPKEYEYTLANHVANLTQLIDELDLRHIILVGHDWGGCIGMGAAVARPDRFTKFVLANTAAFRSTEIPLRIAVCRIPLLGAIGVRGFNGFARAAQWMAVEKRLPAQVRRAYLAPYDSWVNRIATHEFVLDIPLQSSHRSYQTLTDIEAGLAQFVDHPMLLCWGERDWCFTTAFLDEWQQRFPDAEVARFPNANHYVFEDARDEMIDRVRQFVAGK